MRGRGWIPLMVVALVLSGCESDPKAPPPKPPPETAAAPILPDDAHPRFRCLGNEPGWNLTISPDSLVFVGDYGKVRVVYPGVAPKTKPGLWSYEVENPQAPSEYSWMSVTVNRGACSDGMSDRSYEYQAVVHHRTKGATGCAERR